jgi:pimeloyl-ACP methyl ester carboxylesterase
VDAGAPSAPHHERRRAIAQLESHTPEPRDDFVLADSGQGPALILLHGFPENWSAYFSIMPRLALHYRVVALDLRGIGKSKSPNEKYDSATMAEDVYQVAKQLSLDHPYVVGHDFGGWVVYALVRLHPDAVRGVMIIDVPTPGVDPWDKIKVDPRLWHFGFHQAPGLAEKLLAGRESIYFAYFMRRSSPDQRSITDDTIDRYARAYSSPAQMSAAMAMYRAMNNNEEFGKAHRETLNVPLALIAGGNSFGSRLPAMAQGLRDAGVVDVTSETVASAGHYVIDEKPNDVAALIERHASTP